MHRTLYKNDKTIRKKVNSITAHKLILSLFGMADKAICTNYDIIGHFFPSEHEIALNVHDFCLIFHIKTRLSAKHTISNQLDQSNAVKAEGAAIINIECGASAEVYATKENP